METNSRTSALVVRAGGSFLAIPMENVLETMRPLPLEHLSGLPSFVCGLSIIRGEPVPVLDTLLASQVERIERLVLLRIGERRIAIRVEAVIGVRKIDTFLFQDLPPLLGKANREFVSSLGTLDQKLFMMLDTARIVPEDVWGKLNEGGST